MRRANERAGSGGQEGVFDFGGVLGEAVGEGPEHAEGAAEHHVAVGGGEVGLEAAMAEPGALGAGDGEESVGSGTGRHTRSPG